MNTESKICPQCGASLPADAPQGLCPRCLAALNFATETLDSAPVPPKATLTPEELAPHLPQLEIIECLGRGGMGVVYKARQKSLNRLVALKLLAPERADDAKFAERFEKEAHALAALNHPHIVTIHDFGQAGGFYFLLMEFIDGVNLRQAMSAGRFTPEQALAIVPPVCEALQYAHEHGIVHRDIKPENLLMDREGRVKIADFGIAKMIGSNAPEGGESLSQPFGTPTYAAPEQQNDPAHVDHRADIYSLGVVLYELLTGELPRQNLQPPSQRVQIDVRLDEVVLRALETRPEMRFATAAEFRAQLATVTTSPAQQSAARLKTAASYVSTPGHLATFHGRFVNIYTGKGQLVLDDRQLTFSPFGEMPAIIPLAAIRDLSIGQYPATAKPVTLNFISVTYDDGGTRRQQLFTPNEGPLAPAWDTNRLVEDWFKAIQEAVKQATGAVPSSTPANQLGVPRGSRMSVLPLLAVPAGALLVFAALASRSMPLITQMLLMLGGLLLMVAGPVFVGLLSGSSRHAKSLPPQRRPWRWTGALGMLLGAALLIGAEVLNEMVDDFALTATAREHLVKRNKAAALSKAARADASAKVSERDAAQARLQAGANPQDQARLRQEFERLDQEAHRLHQASMRAEQAVHQAAQAKERAEQNRIALFYLFAGALLVAGAGAFFHRARDDAESAPSRPHGRSRLIPSVMAIMAAAIMITAWVFYPLAGLFGTTGRVSSATAELVSVEENVLTADLQILVSDAPVEVRVELNGDPTPDMQVPRLVDAERNTGTRTLVLPGTRSGNHPWRILPPGMHTLRLRFVLPTSDLALKAGDSLQPVGELPAIMRKDHAGTLFMLESQAHADFHATLHVSAVTTAADPRWVSISGARMWNEAGLSATWQVDASSAGLAQLNDSFGTGSQTLTRSLKTSRHETEAGIELTPIGPNRLRIVSSIGGSKSYQEIDGDFTQWRDELLATALNSAKAKTGDVVELCRLNGRPVTLSTLVRPHEHAAAAAAPATVTTPASVTVVNHTWPMPISPIVAIALVIGVVVWIVVRLSKKGRGGCLVAFLIFAGLFAAITLVALTLWGSHRAAEIPFSQHVELRSTAIPRHADTGTFVRQASNFLIARVPAGHLVTMEVFLRQGDDSRVPVPELSAVLGAGNDTDFEQDIYWTTKRADDDQLGKQTWIWTVHGGQAEPARDMEAALTHEVAHGETLNWWQLESIRQIALPAGMTQDYPLFRTHGNATAHPGQPKEMILRVRTMWLPTEIVIPPNGRLILAGKKAHAAMQAHSISAAPLHDPKTSEPPAPAKSRSQ